MTFSPIRCAAVLGTLALAAALPARADIAVTATTEPATYARGRTNTYLLDLHLISDAFSGADALYFSLPDGVTLSAVRKRNTFSFCSDIYPTVMGMGSSEGGWYQLGYPALDGCGSLSASPAPGELQIVLIDVDVPAEYSGDLPLVVNVLGDGIGDAPNEASLTLTLADAGTPVVWGFDEVAAPALPGGWSSDADGAGLAWTTQATAADRGPNAAYVPAPAASGEAVLTSPSVPVPAGGAELQFRQRYATESGRDGGVLEIAIDDGDFVDVLAAGGQFTAGGYGAALEADPACSGDAANPLAGRAAWSGTQAAYGTTTLVLPAAAAGHRARWRWRLGTDCAGKPAAPNGWWIDSVRLTSAPPTVSTPARLAVSTGADVQRIEPFEIGNAGSGQLNWSITVGDGDCSTPASPGWLHLDAGDGVLAGGERGEVALTFDAGGLAVGEYAALLCVSSNDAAQPLRQVPVRLTVEADACPAADRLFANGFDDASDGRCGHALRIYDDRDGFLAHVASQDEQTFTGLRTGYVNGPLRFGAAPFAYSVTAAPHTDLGDLYLFAGSGVLSTVSPGEDSELAITFDTPVTAVGGNFWGQMFQDPTSIEANLQMPTTIVLTLDDGTRETFVANGQQDFRGFVTSQPITGLRVRAPEPVDDGRYVWGVFDNLVVGDAR
ncbi:hypothetical protein [Dokdonella ginsengisoli]|uniref:BACON domain-containing protein n=1 Tax=Dokdonella ginsengisoli TaxID=363846 RepID=A0ABV9QXN8_9GAMM